MSLQRACVNCERCYELADGTIIGSQTRYIGESDEKFNTRIKTEGKIFDPKERKDVVYTDDQVYAARNEAMRALEEERQLGYTIASQDSLEVVEGALDACRSCSYEEPRIVKVVDEGKDYSEKQE